MGFKEERCRDCLTWGRAWRRDSCLPEVGGNQLFPKLPKATCGLEDQSGMPGPQTHQLLFPMRLLWVLVRKSRGRQGISCHLGPCTDPTHILNTSSHKKKQPCAPEDEKLILMKEAHSPSHFPRSFSLGRQSPKLLREGQHSLSAPGHKKP